MAEEKITILMGAGASAGCRNIKPSQPPIGKTLYSELETEGDPTIMTEVSRIVGIQNKENFEEKMKEVFETKIFNLPVISAMLARYFSKYTLTGSDNEYAELIIEINKKNLNCVYCTLNYDCLVEQCAEHLGMNVNYDPIIKKGTFNLWKLHGSCSFFPDGISGPLGNLYTNYMAGSINPRTVKISRPLAIPDVLKWSPLGPIMSFYAEEKPKLVGNSYLDQLQITWKERVFESDKLVIIGAFPNTNDHHIWNPIIESKTQIGYVGRDYPYNCLRDVISEEERLIHLSTDFHKSISSISGFLS